ncbi:MAG: nuclear transport factor 2 family protein [Blastocatellia bacterium]
MKRSLAPIGIILIPLVFYSCASPTEGTKSAATPIATASTEVSANSEKEVETARQEYDKAYVSQDVAAFDRLAADEYLLTQPDGKVSTKAEVIALSKSGDIKVEKGQSDNVKVRLYGNTALVTGQWTEKSTTKGKPFAGTVQYTTVYVKKNGKWQIVSDHGTLIAAQNQKQ